MPGARRRSVTPRRTPHPEPTTPSAPVADHEDADGSYNDALDSLYLVRIVSVRFMGLICLAAFASALLQNVALHSSLQGPSNCRGLDSQPHSIFHWMPCTNENLSIVALAGVVLSAFMLTSGRCNVVILLFVWSLQLSLVNIRSQWYAFGWETQLLETLLWLAPGLPLLSLSRFSVRPSRLTAWYQRFLLLKIMVGAGLIKVRGSPCWTTDMWTKPCMAWHYETQPNPHVLSPFLHYTPLLIHSLETWANHVVELLCPWLLLGPRKARVYGAAIQIAFQAVLIASGNLSFLNWLTMAPALWCLDDRSVSWLFSSSMLGRARSAQAQHSRYDVAGSVGGKILSALGTGSTVVTVNDSSFHLPPSASVWYYSSARTLLTSSLMVAACVLNYPVLANLLSDRQAMNRSFDSWHLANTYGAFGSVHDVRKEIVFEAWPRPDLFTTGQQGDDTRAQNCTQEMMPDGQSKTTCTVDASKAPTPLQQSMLQGAVTPPEADTGWVEYELPCKPGAPSRTPCLITPYHLRLDWLAWFAGSFGTYHQYPWVVMLVNRLLHGADNTASGRDGALLQQVKAGPVLTTLRQVLGPRLALEAHDLLSFDPYRLPSSARASPSRTPTPAQGPVWVKVSHWEYRYTPFDMAAAWRETLHGLHAPRAMHGWWLGPWAHSAAHGASSRAPDPLPLKAKVATALCARLQPYATAWAWGTLQCTSATVRWAADGSGPFLRLGLSQSSSGQSSTSLDVGLWYTRRRIGTWVPALTKDNDSLQQFMKVYAGE